jgi:Peptidase propeptide and YPEB domain
MERCRGSRPSSAPTEYAGREQLPASSVVDVHQSGRVGILFPGRVLADRAPRPEERSRIETMLRNEGYTHWGKIELDDDDDVWAIDDAHAFDGHRYDLRLDPDTLAIITREPY